MTRAEPAPALDMAAGASVAPGGAGGPERASRATRQRVFPGQSQVERAFQAWIDTQDGQRVRGEVVRRALLLLSLGKHMGVAALWEAIRYDDAVRLQASAPKLNNSFRSLMAREVMATVPGLAGYFRTRDLRGRV